MVADKRTRKIKKDREFVLKFLSEVNQEREQKEKDKEKLKQEKEKA